MLKPFTRSRILEVSVPRMCTAKAYLTAWSGNEEGLHWYAARLVPDFCLAGLDIEFAQSVANRGRLHRSHMVQMLVVASLQEMNMAGAGIQDNEHELLHLAHTMICILQER